MQAIICRIFGKVTQWLSIEFAGYYDHMENANVFFGTEWTVEDFDPRLGFIVTPTEKDTFRLAAFRYILPFIPPVLTPQILQVCKYFVIHKRALKTPNMLFPGITNGKTALVL